MTAQEKLAWDKWVTILRNQDVQSASNAQFLLDKIGALEASVATEKARADQAEERIRTLQQKLDGVALTLREGPAARIKQLSDQNEALAALVAEKEKTLNEKRNQDS